MKSPLLQEYYTRRDGTADEFTTLLSCFQAGLYFNLKMKKGIHSPYELFVTDPSFCIDLGHDGSFRDVNAVQRWTCFEVFRTKDTTGKGIEALQEIEKLLDQGEILLLDTHSTRIPFFESFQSLDSHFDPNVHITPYNHLFVAIGHTDNHLIYVESPHLLNRNHMPYENSKCVGVISKDTLLHALNCFAIYRQVVIHEDGLNAENDVRRVVETLCSYDANQRLPSISNPDSVRYFGNEALGKLVQCIRQGLLPIGKRSVLHPTIYEGEVLLWKFRNIRQQYSILYRCLERNTDLFGDHALGLLSAMKKYMDLLEMLENKLRIMQKRNLYHCTGLPELFENMEESGKQFAQELAGWLERRKHQEG
ncbi:hypothetical protein [Paenibacillus sp. SI8]|uniref:hypothetical protein n=1 Tax=unclassified Paenibacillus TaxID=185978 RepID=UPI003464FBC3